MADLCAICLSDLGDDPSLLQTWTGCNQHTFHKACLCGWLMQGKQTCPSCRSNLHVNNNNDVESDNNISSSDSDSVSDSESDSSASSVSSLASSSSSLSSLSSLSSDEEDYYEDDVDFLSECRVRSIRISEGFQDAENRYTSIFKESYDAIIETGVVGCDVVADSLKEAFKEQAMKYKNLVNERFLLYAKLNKYIRTNCPVFAPLATTSAIRKNVYNNKKIMDRFHHVYRRELRNFAKMDRKWDEVSKKFSDIIYNILLELQNTQRLSNVTQRLPTMPDP